jgi:hypothetical protein
MKHSFVLSITKQETIHLEVTKADRRCLIVNCVEIIRWYSGEIIRGKSVY